VNDELKQIADETAQWVVDHYRIGIAYEIGEGNLRVAYGVISQQIQIRLRALAETPLAQDWMKCEHGVLYVDRCSECEAALAVPEAEVPKLVKVAIGTSVLTRDLVWCECGRGLSRSGTWIYCPSCGGHIDQDSYRNACGLAIANGANIHTYHDAELVNELAALRADLDIANEAAVFFRQKAVDAQILRNEE